ncbi:MAG: tripartite tricarboxylate transporter substrate binding protein [Alphaproteobacteria bacterium]|nr:tripartite tricarboxylate transporter substrate binding protein [Alphaproteobacteria bacterium]
MKKRSVLKLVLLALLVAAPAHAQNYPSKPLKFIVPFPPGGLVDVTGRLVAQKLSEKWGQPIVVENRTGASGMIGSDAVAKSPADGYTLLFTTGDFLTTPNAVPLPFDPNKDLLPISMVARAPLVLVGNANSPITSIAELIAAAKSSPGTIGYSSSGNGTINHLAGEWMSIEAGIKLLHVPYRGGVPAVTGVAAGDVPIGVLTPSAVASLVEAKKVRVLALMTKDRAQFVPDWPTLGERGIANIDAALWVGLFAPGGTPAAIVDKIDQELGLILKDEAVRKRLNDLGTEPSPISQQAFVQQIRTDAARYHKVAEQAGIKIEH